MASRHVIYDVFKMIFIAIISSIFSMIWPVYIHDSFHPYTPQHWLFLYDQQRWKQRCPQYLTSDVWYIVSQRPTFRICQIIAKLGQTMTARSHDSFMVLITALLPQNLRLWTWHAKPYWNATFIHSLSTKYTSTIQFFGIFLPFPTPPYSIRTLN